MDEFRYALRIPKDRIAVLIGQKGKVKKDLEKECNSKITIDSNEGEVTIQSTDSIKLFTLKEIIQAIGRGFNPEIAKLLLHQDYTLEIIHINEYVKGRNHIVRVRGRLIGTGGKARRTIEDLTETNICVYGKTASIIGRLEDVSIAKKAIESLLEGSMHSTVYKWLEKYRRRKKIESIKEW